LVSSTEAIARPGVTSALLEPRSMACLDELLAGAEVLLTDDVLDRIDEVGPPGTHVGAPDRVYTPIQNPHLCRRPTAERTAA